MNILKKLAGINLIILLVITVIGAAVGFNEHGQYKGLGAMILMAFGVGLHTAILFAASLIQFVRKNNESGRAFLLSALLVLVVGFSACFGIASLF
jgi:hypothetical protein